MGGITHMRPDEEFPGYSDVDMMLVVSGPTTTKDPLDEPYQGLAIEAGLRGVEEYETAGRVLANPEIADHIAVGAILADPSGVLGTIQAQVAREFSRRRWVQARCEEEKRRYETGIGAVSQSSDPLQSLVLMSLAMHDLASVLAVARLVPPTHRKSLVLLGQQLAEVGQLDLYGEVLEVSGIARLTVAQVQSYLDRVTEAFDRAVQVHRTRVPFDFKVRPHLRRYLLEGSQVLIDVGHHREAMPWIANGIALCTWILLADAPEIERPSYQRLVQDLLQDTGFEDAATLNDRVGHADRLKRSIYAIADEVVAGTSDELIPA